MVGLNIIKSIFSENVSEKYAGRLRDEISQVKQALENVRRQYEDVCEDDLIEALIYEELSLMARYRFLIKEARREAFAE